MLCTELKATLSLGDVGQNIRLSVLHVCLHVEFGFKTPVLHLPNKI